MRTAILAAVLTSLLASPAGASAATKPAVSTGGAAHVTPTSATLTGSVDPQGSSTSYVFQYGKTRAYGAQTGPASAGRGSAKVAATADVTGLAPATTYHYRLVATNAGGTTPGGDRSFRTAPQPLGFSLAATPNPVPFGGATTLAGQLTGTGSANRGVALQGKAFPYTTAFQPVGNQQITNAAGSFSFPVPALTANTQFRVVTNDGKATSPIVIVGSAVTVRLALSSHRPRSHSLVRFAGTVTPREEGALYAVQRLSGTRWVTIGGSSLRPYRAMSSRFAKRVRIAHSGSYRVYVGVADGSHVSSASSVQHIHVRSRY